MTRQELEQVRGAVKAMHPWSAEKCGFAECDGCAALAILDRELAPERTEWGVRHRVYGNVLSHCTTKVAAERAVDENWHLVSRIRAGEWTPAPELEPTTPTEAA